jgi:hypothetical protein
MTFDRKSFEEEMELFKEIPTLMNEEWTASELIDGVHVTEDRQSSLDDHPET